MDITTTLLLALVCIAIGFMLSALIFSLRGVRAGSQTAAKKDADLVDKAIRLTRDQRNESLVVELDGTMLKSTANLKPEQRQRLAQASSDFRTWLGIFPSKPHPTDTIADPFLHSQADTSAQEGEVPEWLSQMESTQESDRPSLNPFKIFTQPLQDNENNIPTKSITAQIDEILQEKLINTPLEERGIHLIEKPGQGITVMVGLDSYDSVEAVPEASVQAIIRQAVAEWENRTTR